MSADQERGRHLAELARQFVLWLQENDLPGVPGLREYAAGDGDPARTFDRLVFHAGLYQRVIGPAVNTRFVPSFLHEAPKEDRDRIARLSFGPPHFLISKSVGLGPIATIAGQPVYANRILRDQKVPLHRQGALVTMAPRLDSLRPDLETLRLWAHRDFCTLVHETDLVWDDKATAARAGFGHATAAPGAFDYLSLLEGRPPRKPYAVNVESVPVPDAIFMLGNKDLRNQNAGSRLIAQRTMKFRQYLLDRATYRNGYSGFGDYYRKWKAEVPRREQRQFRPALLSDEYLRAAFRENRLKTGDDMLLIELRQAFFLYRLSWDRLPWLPGARFLVEPLLQSISEDVPEWPKQAPARGGVPWWLQGGVDACVFSVASGGDRRPDRHDRALLQRSTFPERFVVDYHALVRSYYGGVRGLDTDKQFFDRFVRTFFPDPSSVFEHPSLKAPDDLREKLFLAELRRNVEATPAGPLKDYQAKLVEWCDGDPRRFVLTQGMFHGGGPRQFIGISGVPPDVFEWNTETGLVTRIRLDRWLEQMPLAELSHLVYENTKGVMGLVALVFAAAVAPVAAVVIPEATLAYVGRTVIKEVVVEAAGKKVVKELARKFAPQLVGLIVQGVMRLLPSSDALWYRFLKGFSEGLGTSAVQHYLTGIDERLERQLRRVPAAIAYRASPTAYRAYRIYAVADKLGAAGVRLAKLYEDWGKVASADLPQRLASQLGRVYEGAGAAFLVALVVAVYLVEASSEKKKTDPHAEARKWVDKQKDALKFMVKETTEEAKKYAGKLRELIEVKGGADKVTTRDLGPHDAELAKGIKAKLIQGVKDVSGMTDLLALFLEEMGVENWDELRKLGFTELVARGWDALPVDALKPAAAETLGKAVGELFSTFMMERQIVPKRIRRTSGPLLGTPTSKFLKAGLADGTFRNLLWVLVQPFQEADLVRLPDKLRAAIEKSREPRFVQVRDEGAAYRNLREDLLAHDENLAKRLVKLAENDALVADLEKLVASALGTDAPPALSELKGDDARWPAHAIAFVLNSWIRVAVKELGTIFTIIEDRTQFAEKFSVAELLSILGLDVALDDEAVEGMRAVFPFPKQASAGS